LHGVETEDSPQLIPPLRIAAAILTKNEAARLPVCLSAIPADTPAVIVDSGSTDATLDIARAHGCRILQRDWTGFADQRNFTLQALSGAFDWVVFIDADEIFPQAIWAWARDQLAQVQADVVSLSQRIHIGGRMLRHAPHYPIYHPRIVRVQPAVFVNNNSGHGETVRQGISVQYVDIPYNHYIIDRDPGPWLKKHVDLALMEAKAAPSQGMLTARARLNALMPAGFLRAPARFLFHYVYCGGWRDGRPGFLYAALYGWYELAKWLAAYRCERAGAAESGELSAHGDGVDHD
jgi:glycosyltransferase involved in cell wall biosynthesis